jgi:hypothetical protein
VGACKGNHVVVTALISITRSAVTVIDFYP